MHALLEAIDSENWDGLAAMLAPSSWYLAPGMRLYRGRDEIMAYYLETRPVASGVHRIERAIEAGDEAMAFGTFSGLDKRGAAIDLTFSDWAKFDGGLVTAREVFVEPIKD